MSWGGRIGENAVEAKGAIRAPSARRQRRCERWGRCLSCGGRLPAQDRFCSECGQGATALQQYSSLLGPILAGVVVGIIGNATGRLVPTPEGHGFLGSILSIVHRTTFPYFDVAFGFIAGWTATSALGNRRTSTAAVAAGLGVATLLTGSLAVATLAAHGEPHPARLAWMAILAWVGAIIAASAAAPLARSTRVGRRRKCCLAVGPSARPWAPWNRSAAHSHLRHRRHGPHRRGRALDPLLHTASPPAGSRARHEGITASRRAGGSIPRRGRRKSNRSLVVGPTPDPREDGAFRWRVDAQGLAWDRRVIGWVGSTRMESSGIGWDGRNGGSTRTGRSGTEAATTGAESTSRGCAGTSTEPTRAG